VEGIDTLVYGCTHYPLLANELLEVLPEGIQPVNPAVSLVSAVRKELECLGLLAHGRRGSTQFFVSGNDADRFAHLAARLLAPTTGAFRGVHPLIRVRSVCLDAVPATDATAIEDFARDAALMPSPLHAD
ncbi:MAG: hypothetical protein AAFX40_12595, partial [Cyanobacteria bacterium J06639_1]